GRSASGQGYDSGDYPGTLERALAAIDYDSFRRRQAEERGGTDGAHGAHGGGGASNGRHYLGIGLAAYVQASGLGPSKVLGRGGSRGAGFESARVVMDPQGRVTVYTGVSPHGQGLATTSPSSAPTRWACASRTSRSSAAIPPSAPTARWARPGAVARWSAGRRYS